MTVFKLAYEQGKQAAQRLFGEKSAEELRLKLPKRQFISPPVKPLAKAATLADLMATPADGAPAPDAPMGDTADTLAEVLDALPPPAMRQPQHNNAEDAGHFSWGPPANLANATSPAVFGDM